MANMLLNTGTATFSELIGDGKMYIVPPFQRDYSWQEEEWEDLWLDILDLSEEPLHYMGYVVFQSDKGKNFKIIDGQQRFTTLSIIAISVIKILEDWIGEKISPKENEERKELLRAKFLGHKDPSSLIPTSRLILNRNNNDFYKSYLLRLRKPSNINKLRPSEKRLWKAFDFFYNKISQKFENDKNGENLSKFLNETISDNLVFTTINVADDLNAYKVFETLNARGVKLSVTDLLKNFLFSIVAKSSEIELDEAERQWQNINNLLNNTDFPTFLRHYWNSKNKLERKQTLFKVMKKSINNSENVFNLLNDLEATAPIYIAFSNPSDIIWNKDDRKYIDALTLFDVTQCYSLLLAAHEKFDESEFTKLLRGCMVISFRYNIISSLNPTEMENIYNKTSIKISSGELSTSREVFNELKPIYVSDENFVNVFTTKIINTKRSKNLIRYILFNIENQVSEKEYDYRDGKATIEHILPENASDEWLSFFNSDEQDNCVYRIGNYTLLETKKNSDCANKPYLEKLDIYKDSSYKLTNDESIFTEWNPEILRKRQEKLANYAKAIWKINF